MQERDQRGKFVTYTIIVILLALLGGMSFYLSKLKVEIDNLETARLELIGQTEDLKKRVDFLEGENKTLVKQLEDVAGKFLRLEPISRQTSWRSREAYIANQYQEYNTRTTGYTPDPREGSGTGICSTGLPVWAGVGIGVAVNPHYIPLGSIVALENANGKFEYRVAVDTIGVPGNVIDVLVATKEEAHLWTNNYRKVRVY